MLNRLFNLPSAAVWLIVIAVGAILPGILSDRVLLLLIAGLYGIAAVGLDMLIGYAGQISFGQAGFVAMGAYGSSLLSLDLDWPPLLAIPVAAGGVAVFAWLLGSVIFRLRGHYLAMGTFAFGQVVFLLVGTLEWTGSLMGLYAMPPLSPLGLDIVSASAMYYVVWTAVAVAVAASMRIRASQVGRALIALRYDEAAAESAGIDAQSFKTRVFGISGFLAGLSGALFAHYFSVVSPDSFSVQLSILLMAIVIVGGIGTGWGVVVGTMVLTLVPGLLLTSSRYNGLICGLPYVAGCPDPAGRQHSAHDPRTPIVQSFAAEFRRKYGREPVNYNGIAFDGVNLLPGAIRRAGTDPAAIRKALESAEKVIGTSAVIEFRPDNHNGPTVQSLVMATIRDGKLVAMR